MGPQIFRSIPKRYHYLNMFVRCKTTSSQYVASRARDPTFEKLMDRYKNLLKVVAVQDLILANPRNQSVSLEFLLRLSQKLHLNRGAASFLRKYPHIFHIFYDPNKTQPFCKLTDTAIHIVCEEADAINASLPQVVGRLVRLLSMSNSKMLPLRAIYKVWREFGLPDNFEDCVISKNSHIFQLCDAHEPNTHFLKLVDDIPRNHFQAAVDEWRVTQCCKDGCTIDETEIKYSFKHSYPPGMRLRKTFKAKVKDWQRCPYTGPYEGTLDSNKYGNTAIALEKRAVSIIHEFMTLTVEKMVEVEKISHFRKWFGIELNIRDLFLDHPGIFYLSTKGKRHTVFLREAYERGCLIDPNPVYTVRRKLLDFVDMGRRGLPPSNLRQKVDQIHNEDGDFPLDNK
ncbi:protein ROOT PRIMORDIUM DEFECTIVE 1 [Cucurbita maxima]|uniref:Protein ROOT PRIMORDIUM DEFECTIVE 1 n=1 Tax=Cucurbita maxima TaxID=3661 RepID=A0A6J1JGE7_CUCMA|nr:protein ROOT PRIMORDIUM DEFECTIVE 1 [Cucurbita maxima]XP_022988147.1 protein ROOT PRIMORDIUM DEFECTIVE 1 [Cucurbita maxima]